MKEAEEFVSKYKSQFELSKRMASVEHCTEGTFMIAVDFYYVLMLFVQPMALLNEAFSFLNVGRTRKKDKNRCN